MDLRYSPVERERILQKALAPFKDFSEWALLHLQTLKGYQDYRKMQNDCLLSFFEYLQGLHGPGLQSKKLFEFALISFEELPHKGGL